jgi:hypothetical protein
VNLVPSAYSTFFLLAFFVLLFPWRFLVLGATLTAGIVYVLFRLNELKLAAIALPITFLDLKTLVVDPSIVVNAVGLDSLWTPRMMVSGLLLIAVVLATVAYIRRMSGARLLPLPSRLRGDQGRLVLFKATTLAVLIGVGAVCLTRNATFAHAHAPSLYAKACADLWTPSCQATLSRRLGVMEYVAFTYLESDLDSTVVSRMQAGARPPGLRAATAQFVNLANHPRTPAPNIVFFHAESTFDPNDVFRLTDRVELPLWSRGAATSASGPLRVNVIGGGTWVTEFEVLTGVDSRLFGYQGHYTHTYLAPMVRNSFPRYLTDKGYRTAAYYSVEGHVFNAEPAFRAYGIEEFVGGSALGLPDDWSSIVDRDIAKAVIARGAFKRPGPFFYLINTEENHGPHRCRSNPPASGFRVAFQLTASPEQTCILHEYLRRARSTSDAFEMVAEQLKAIERDTGRPYVLLAYGDHQPWSFTDGLYSVAGGVATEPGVSDFSRLRATTDGYVTFFHLRASAPAVLTPTRFAEPPPATLLPTLASAFVASTEEDLYMPLNLLAFSTCGSDFRRPGCSLDPHVADWMRASLFTKPFTPAPGT